MKIIIVSFKYISIVFRLDRIRNVNTNSLILELVTVKNDIDDYRSTLRSSGHCKSCVKHLFSGIYNSVGGKG